MANNALIQGEAALRKTQGFVDYGAKLKPAMETARRANVQAKREKERKVEAIQAGINTNMGKMKTDMDLTGLAPDQQTAIKDFLLHERGRYAEAANAVSKIGDASDPQHAYYTDIMNGVNNSFVNLNKQLTSYKENKLDFAQTSKEAGFSNGQDPVAFNDLASIYRLEGDPAEMFVSTDGNLAFAANGNETLYNDVEEPILKDAILAKAYTAKANEIYTLGQEMTDVAKANYMIDLDIMLKDPNAIKSIISQDFTSDGLDFSDVVFDETDVQATRDQVKNIMIQSFSDVASEGAAEKRRKQRLDGKTSAYMEKRQVQLNNLNKYIEADVDKFTIGGVTIEKTENGYLEIGSDGLPITDANSKYKYYEDKQELQALLGL
jgi:hypothetical protein